MATAKEVDDVLAAEFPNHGENISVFGIKVSELSKESLVRTIGIMYEQQQREWILRENAIDIIMKASRP